MQSNPLLLANKKLHAATNLIFDEGVIRTRPGFRYRPLGVTGQFQGACEYRPHQGISAGRFADEQQGIAVVADGKLWFNCQQVGDEFCGKGDVHVFQAENYLVLQNLNSDTFWWDGVDLTRSPGLQEQDWNDPETPVQEMDIERPVADIPVCDAETGRESGIRVVFLVIDGTTEQPIPGVYGLITHNSHKAFERTTDAVGQFEFYPTPRIYQYTLTKTGYLPIADAGLVVNGDATEVIYDPCMPPAIVLNGEVEVVVRMTPTGGGSGCGFTSEVIAGPLYTPPWAGGYVDIRVVNTGTIPVIINSVLASWPDPVVHGGLPVTIPVGEEDILSVGSEAYENDIAGGQVQFLTSCGDSDAHTLDTLASYSVQKIGSRQDTGNDDATEGCFEVTNTGHVPITITGVTSSTGSATVSWWSGLDSFDLPKTISPGESTYIMVTDTSIIGPDPGPSWDGETFTVMTDLLDPTSHIWIDPGEFPFLIPYGD